MKVTKTILGVNDKVYATCIGDGQDGPVLIGCSEGPGAAHSFSGGEKRTIWEQPGGTMNFVQVPGEAGVYLATQRFLPVFDAKECMLNKVVETGAGWEVSPIMPFPYLHRFDLFNVGDDVYFFGATLCGHKDFQQDWSSPGSIYVAKLSSDRSHLDGVREIYRGITKNHGLWRQPDWGRAGAFFVAGTEGAFCFDIPENPLSDVWPVSKVLDGEVSDLALCDVDDDGRLELAAISPFHGNTCTIYRMDDMGNWHGVVSYDIDFGHVIWGGTVAGRQGFLLGDRRKNMELSLITTYRGTVYCKKVIDSQVGPSQISVMQQEGRTLVLSANRQINELALYTIE